LKQSIWNTGIAEEEKKCMPVIAENAVKQKNTILSNMSEIRTPMNAIIIH
jgi:hypothetical protein